MNHISEFEVEKSTYDLFAIWLESFFDGASHVVGGNAAVPFPLAALTFAQSALPQPMNETATVAPSPAPRVGITMVFAKSSGKVQRRRTRVGVVSQQVYYRPVRWNFWVRCETADDQSRALCMQAADRLAFVLGNAAATRPLAQQGVQHIRPGTPEPVADNTFIMRLVPCVAVLRYTVRSQT